MHGNQYCLSLILILLTLPLPAGAQQGQTGRHLGTYRARLSEADKDPLVETAPTNRPAPQSHNSHSGPRSAGDVLRYSHRPEHDPSVYWRKSHDGGDHGQNQI